jgi:hypothetical protein
MSPGASAHDRAGLPNLSPEVAQRRDRPLPRKRHTHTAQGDGSKSFPLGATAVIPRTDLPDATPLRVGFGRSWPQAASVPQCRMQTSHARKDPELGVSALARHLAVAFSGQLLLVEVAAKWPPTRSRYRRSNSNFRRYGPPHTQARIIAAGRWASPVVFLTVTPASAGRGRTPASPGGGGPVLAGGGSRSGFAGAAPWPVRRRAVPRHGP